MHRNLGGGRVFRHRQLGVLLASRSHYRLEFDGGDHEVFEGSLGGVAPFRPPSTPGVALLANVLGSHEPLRKRQRPHGPRKWSRAIMQSSAESAGVTLTTATRDT